MTDTPDPLDLDALSTLVKRLDKWASMTEQDFRRDLKSASAAIASLVEREANRVAKSHEEECAGFEDVMLADGHVARGHCDCRVSRSEALA